MVKKMPVDRKQFGATFMTRWNADFDLGQIYKDQGPEFFISKGIKPGIAQRFVEDIRGWVEECEEGTAYLLSGTV